MNVRRILRKPELLSMVVCLALSAGLSMVARADQPDMAVISELTGMRASQEPLGPEWVFDAEYQIYLAEPDAVASPQATDPAALQRAHDMLRIVGLLIIPDSSNKRLMAFDPLTGDVVALDFIILDPDATGTPIHAILGPSNTFLVSDQTRNVVHQYDLDGNYLGVFAPAGGENTAIMQNIRGIALRPNGNLLVSVGGGTNTNAIAEFDQEGNYLGNFVANGSGGLNSPFDVYERVGTDWLVSSINSNQILSYDLDTGVFIGEFAPVTSFPQQHYEIPGGGNVLVGNFSGAQVGVVELTTDGQLVGVYRPGTMSGFRGVYELHDGPILATSTDGVFVIDRDGNLVDTKYSGQSRFIEYVVMDLGSVGDDQGGSTSLEPRIGRISPNPFSFTTAIEFTLPRAESATVSVHDLQGRLVSTLMAGPMDGGRHQTTWDGLDSRANEVPSGIYMLRLSAGDGPGTTMKITVMR